MMSSSEEEDDEHSLDNGKEGSPQQEDVDQGTLGRLWHRQCDSRAWGSQEDDVKSWRLYKSWVSFAMHQKQCVCVCFLSTACACDEDVLTPDCVLPYLHNEKESRW